VPGPLRTPLTVVVTLASAVAAYVLVGKIFEQLRAPAELKEWKTRTVVGIEVNSPGEFKTTPLDFGEVAKFMDKSDNFTFEASGFQIVVLRAIYKPEVQLSMDGAVNGMVSSVGALEGVRNLKHTANPTTVSGKPAERVSFTGDRTLDGKSGVIHAEGLLILDGRTFYQVQAFYDSGNPHGADYAERVVQSVKLAQ